MKTFPDPDKDDALLEAVLRDEQWQAASASAKGQALDCLRGHRRQRRIREWTFVLVLVNCLIAGSFWLGTPGGKRGATVAGVQSPPISPPAPGAISSEQLVAMFPKGSCVIAEVNGRKELVFLDKEIETKGCVVRWNRDGGNAVK